MNGYSRIQIIPAEYLLAWRNGTSGPWDFFKDKDITGAHIAIDEAHNYAGKNKPKDVRQKWLEWLGEIRHRQCTVELLSQHVGKIDRDVRDACEVRYTLENSELQRDPWFKILIADWYELRAAWITRRYQACIWQHERKQVDEKWKAQDTVRWTLDPSYFPLYDSFSAPQGGGGAGSAGKPREFETRTRLGLTLWFIWRNWFKLFIRFTIVGILIWLTTGGCSTILEHWMHSFREIGLRGTHAQGTPTNSGVPSGNSLGGIRGNTSNPSTLPDVKELVKANETLTSKVKKLEELLAQATEVTLITPDTVTFRAGYTYHAHERIDCGPHQGKTITHIDWQRRTVTLSDNTLLRMQ